MLARDKNTVHCLCFIVNAYAKMENRIKIENFIADTLKTGYLFSM